MSAITDTSRRGLALIERLLAALTDPARRERTAAVVILGYVGLWTLYAILAKGSQDIHVDMAEQHALARELAWGYPKHPPLAMAIVRAWFSVLPTTDWAYYLLAMATIGLTLWLVWRLSALFLDGEKRVVGVALLMLVPFFNFHALKFNSNTVLMPLWAATTLFFLRSFATRRVSDAALAGLCAALAMYGKYWSVFLLLGLGIAALVDRRRMTYFRSGAPWVTVTVGAIALAPHAAWVVASDFAPFSYALATHGDASMVSTMRGVLSYLGGGAAYVAGPIILVLVIARPSGAALADMAWPRSADRRLAAVAYWGGLLLPALVAPLIHVHLTSIWSMSAWSLLPIMLLSSPLVAISRRDAVHVLALAVAFPIVMIAIAPAIALGTHRAGLAPAVSHSSLLAEPVERIWRETTDRPLLAFAGLEELTFGVPFYLRSHPRAAHVLDGYSTRADEDLIARDGIALLCPMGTALRASNCVNTANARARCFPSGRRTEVEVSRRHLGVAGKPARYLLITIPPHGSVKLPSLREPITEFAASHLEPAAPPSSGTRAIDEAPLSRRSP